MPQREIGLIVYTTPWWDVMERRVTAILDWNYRDERYSDLPESVRGDGVYFPDLQSEVKWVRIYRLGNSAGMLVTTHMRFLSREEMDRVRSEKTDDIWW